MNSLVLELKYGAENYKPLPVILTRAKGVYCWDERGKQYIDMLSAYSALNHGHAHQRLLDCFIKQAQTLTLTSRAFYNDKLGYFLEKICKMTGYQRALPMNTGAEAVETALKAARKWGYRVKKIPENQAEIIVCAHNFHGRTTTIISMSTEPQYREGFGPFTPGFKAIPFNDVDALEKAITKNTAAFLVEPIQGEAGIQIPEPGYLKNCAKLCKKNQVLFFVDEIQTGLGRTGKLLASDYDEVKPDGITLGKALGGGLVPVSLFLSSEEVMSLFKPGDHGSTFGGNPLASAIAKEALAVLEEENLIDNAKVMGDYFMQVLRGIKRPWIEDIRGKGLLIGLEIDNQKIPTRQLCLKLLEAGLLTMDTHKKVIRLAPPLIINKSEIDEVIEKMEKVFSSI